jgi:hypothetical protein
MWPEFERRGRPRPQHAYEIFDDGNHVGRLEWRLRPRSVAGWYLTIDPRAPERLHVDPAIDDLAKDKRSATHDWELHAELAAILSTALALDAAELFLHPERELPRGRFRRIPTFGGYEIHVTDVDPAILARAVPELHLQSVANVVILAGVLASIGLETALRRIALLGGRVVAVFRMQAGGDDVEPDEDDDGDAEIEP